MRETNTNSKLEYIQKETKTRKYSILESNPVWNGSQTTVYTVEYISQFDHYGPSVDVGLIGSSCRLIIPEDPELVLQQQ